MKKLLFIINVFIVFSLVACAVKEAKVEETTTEVETTAEETAANVVETMPSNEASKLVNAVPSIYRTIDEWKERYKVPEYKENKELTEEEANDLLSTNPNLLADCKSGKFIGYLDDDVLTWKGIPYAKAPTGELRFKKSVSPDDSDKYFEALYFGKTAIQPTDLGEKASLYEQGEDCLKLNVWTSTNVDARTEGYKDTKKPVFVYIHGGGWSRGGTSDPLYDGWNFAHYNPDVIVVTLTYRVGMFGQINLTSIDGENVSIASSSFPTSTANSVLDQTNALKWIYENIESFGGDKENITVAGESAGGGSVSLLCTRPEARQYIKKAIPMSGGVDQATTLDLTSKLQEAFISEFNIKSKEDIANIKEEDIKYWWQTNCDSYLHHCVQDGVNIMFNPIDAWKNGDTSDLIVMQGHTASEFRYYLHVFLDDEDFYSKFCDVLYENLKKETEGNAEGMNAIQKYEDALLSLGYKKEDLSKEYANDKTLAFINTYQASMHSRNGGKGYSYTFEKSYDGEAENIGAGHAVDCFYLFGNFDGNAGFGTDDEVELSRKYQKMLSNFCLTGDPSIEGYVWPEYNEDTRYKMMFGDNLRVEENPERARVEAEMEMAEKTTFLKTSTISAIASQVATEYPRIMDNFLFNNFKNNELNQLIKKYHMSYGNDFDSLIEYSKKLNNNEKDLLITMFVLYKMQIEEAEANGELYEEDMYKYFETTLQDLSDAIKGLQTIK